MALTNVEFTRKCGLWVRALRRRLDMTQEDLGRLTGTNKEPISRWENGTRTPSALNLLRLLALATEDERLALFDKAMEGVDDIIMVEGGETEARCAECDKQLRARDYAAIGWPVPPLRQKGPYAVRLCTDCTGTHGWPS